MPRSFRPPGLSALAGVFFGTGLGAVGGETVPVGAGVVTLVTAAAGLADAIEGGKRCT